MLFLVKEFLIMELVLVMSFLEKLEMFFLKIIKKNYLIRIKVGNVSMFVMKL